jgi:hypothetical protein
MPDMILHIGRPDQCAPHRDLSKIVLLQKNSPKTKWIGVVWTKEDKEELDKQLDAHPELNKDFVGSVLWEDDAKLKLFLIDRLNLLIGAQIVSPRWLVCPNRHETREVPQGMGDNEHCSECGQKTVIMTPFIERLQEFAVVFGTCINLTNFDTGSGHVLFNLVDPRRNILLNMSHAFGDKQAKDVKGSAKGKTVIIVAAGPSVEDQLQDLARLSQDHTVVCVGRTFKMLKAAGVKVAYTYSVEMFDWDAAIFKDVTAEEAKDTTLLFATVCAPETVAAWPGAKMCVWDAETGGTILKRDDWIVGGNSVAHHMLNFAAQILEADTIIMCGVDLAYSKPKTHADGTTPASWPKEALAKDTSFHMDDFFVECTGEGDNFHPDCHQVPIADAMSIQRGSDKKLPILVKSSASYENFATLFEILIAKHGKKVMNACPNGQLIRGTQYVDLKELK